MRKDNRLPSEIRPVVVEMNPSLYAEGSVLISSGNTKVLCTATVDDKVPPFLRGSGSGWVTAEYDMLPRATKERNLRDRNRISGNGRTLEIQRLIGRALRAVCQLDLLGERTIILDCDVLQADGGTRTTAITGSWLAMTQAMAYLMRESKIRHMPVKSQAAAISVGIVDAQLILDLCYEEDSNAIVDMNVVMTDRGDLIEMQGCGERGVFSRSQMDKMLDMAEEGLKQLFDLQYRSLHDYGIMWHRAIGRESHI